MLKEMPCGCKLRPIKRFYQLESRLLSGDSVWFDDPRCPDHQEGTDTFGMMAYQDGAVHSLITKEGNTKSAKLSLDKALAQLQFLDSIGFDFAYGKKH